MTLAQAHLDNGKKIRYRCDQKIGEGTEKIFFPTEREDLVIGFYRDEEGIRDPERLKRLRLILDQYNPTLDPKNGDFWKDHFCWPIAIVTSPEMGILCPRFPDKYYFSDSRGEKKGRWFTSKRLTLTLPADERGDLRTRIQIGRHLARAVGRMHAAGLAHSDLSGNNILMAPRSSACILIDIDSLVVRGIFPPKVLGTRGYIAPEVMATSLLPLGHREKQLPDIRTDLHSLTVILYQLLLMRHPLEGKKIHSDDPEEDDRLMFGEKALFIEHPHDASNRPDDLDVRLDRLGPYLSPLFTRAFTEGLTDPYLRPTAYEWVDALTLTLDILHPCRNPDCWHQWFACRRGLSLMCPFCGWKPEDPILLMHLFRGFKQGQYISDERYLTLWDRRELHEWHGRLDVSPPQGLSGGSEAVGAFFLENGKWRFENRGREKMRSSSGKSILPGRRAEIVEGTSMQLHDPPQGRLALFQFLPTDFHDPK